MAQAAQQVAAADVQRRSGPAGAAADAIQAYVHGGSNPLTSGGNAMTNATNSLLRAEYVNSLATNQNDAIDQYRLAALQEQAAKSNLQQQTTAAQSKRPAGRPGPPGRGRRPVPATGHAQPGHRPDRGAGRPAAGRAAAAAAAAASPPGRSAAAQQQPSSRGRGRGPPAGVGRQPSGGLAGGCVHSRAVRPAPRRPVTGHRARWLPPRAGSVTPTCGGPPGPARSTVRAW